MPNCTLVFAKLLNATQSMPSDAAMTERERRAWLAIVQNGCFARDIVDKLTFEAFCEDRLSFYAATRCLEIVSEASRRLRGSQQENHPTIEWRQIEDSGNVFRHDYEGVEERRVWRVITEKIPKLLSVASEAIGRSDAASD